MKLNFVHGFKCNSAFNAYSVLYRWGLKKTVSSQNKAQKIDPLKPEKKVLLVLLIKKIVFSRF